jgi:hypothetical protein
MAKKAEFAGKTVSTECIVALADDTLGSMCAFAGKKGNVMIDAKSWTPEAKALVMGECNPDKAKQLCTVIVTGAVDSSGSVVKIKNASVKKK